MDVAAVSYHKPAASALLLAHCSLLETEDRHAPPIAVRLEALLGSELAKRLVSALSTAP